MVNVYPKQKDDLMNIYREAKTEFFRYAPFFSRYSNTSHLNEIENLYKDNQSLSETSKLVLEDLEYGRSRQQIAQQLLTLLSNATAIPKHPDIQALPKSSSGKNMVALIMNAVVDLNMQRVK